MVKSNSQSSEGFFRPFGVVIKQQYLDDDVKLWSQEQLKNKIVETGLVLLRQLGQDVQGNHIFAIKFDFSHRIFF